MSHRASLATARGIHLWNCGNVVCMECMILYSSGNKITTTTTQLRTSSHTLAIEYGRYTRPKTKIEDRNCSICHVLEDERHFVMDCTINQPERENMFSKLARLVPNYTHMNDDEKFLFLMCNKDPQISTWVGKFIHKSFKDWAEHLS